MSIGCYIHIPFCRRQCFYCHFVKTGYDADSVDRYVTALAREIELRTVLDIDTVYFGGGSPSLLTESQVQKITGALYRHFRIERDTEFTVEMNPEDVTPAVLSAWKAAGANRLSIGTQSFQARDLDYLKRTHSAEQSLTAIETALDTGFANISIDYIISLPGQTRETLAAGFEVMERYQIPHVSVYILEDVLEGEEKDERDNDLYFFAVEHLAGMGYEQYEVSNFCRAAAPQGVERTDYRASHNLKYWRNEDYVGLGLGASGYEGGEDYRNVTDFDVYFDKIASDSLPRAEVVRRDRELRRLVMGLRLTGPIGSLLEKPPGSRFDETIKFLLDNGLLVRRDENIAVPPGKILLLNEILSYF